MQNIQKNKLLLIITALSLAALFWFVLPGVKGIEKNALKKPPDHKTLLMDEAEIKYEAAGQINIINAKTLSSSSPITLPILMYHHIRDYNKPNDPIGMKLSVSPKIFSAQLDEIAKLGYQTIDFKDLENGDIPKKPIMLTFDDGYNDFYTNAYPEIIKRKMKATAFIITGVIGSPAYMPESQIKEMAANGIEMGSHTVNHPGLALLPDDKQKKEIDDSKVRLEKILGTTITSFCYPYGNYNDHTVAYVERAGYKYAVTTKTGEGNTDNPFLLKRIRMPDRTDVGKLLKNLQMAEKK